MLRHCSLLLFSLAALTVTTLAYSHHSGAAYDKARVVRISGEVEEWSFRNPHSWLRLKVPEGEGGGTVWKFEALPAGLLAPKGWRRSSMKPGDVVTIYFNPMRGESLPGGNLVGAVLADGTMVGTTEID